MFDERFTLCSIMKEFLGEKELSCFAVDVLYEYAQATEQEIDYKSAVNEAIKKQKHYTTNLKKDEATKESASIKSINGKEVARVITTVGIQECSIGNSLNIGKRVDESCYIRGSLYFPETDSLLIVPLNTIIGEKTDDAVGTIKYYDSNSLDVARLFTESGSFITACDYIQPDEVYQYRGTKGFLDEFKIALEKVNGKAPKQKHI